MKPLKIYLCDLTHDTVVLVSDTIPINIGFIGSYAKQAHGDFVDISLFKYPQSVITSIKDNPPDIIAFSNYSWNSNLSEHVASIAKSVNEHVITVIGGTNFPHKAEQQLDYIRKSNGSVDFFVELEGEVAFSNIVSRVLSARDGVIGVFEGPIDGCVFIQPETINEKEPILVKGAQPERIKSLDDIPSPYLNGMLDHFFDGRLSPFIETNRGCPFMCSFCHTGNEYFQKINMFSSKRITAELEYIALKAAEQKNAVLHLADTNFGMFPRDREICETLLKVQKKHHWPHSIMSTTGKNNKDRVIDITGILGDTFEVTMSVQSMDADVLSNINRSNIKLDDYMEINKALQQAGRATAGEIILGLPGESLKSFIKGVQQVIDSGVSRTTIYSLMMLYGTEFKDPEYRKKYEMVGKQRIVPLNFGEYEGTKIFDYEEICISTKDLSFSDYQQLRQLALLVETMHNNLPFEEFYRYALNLGLSRFDFLLYAFESLDQAPEKIRQNFDSFVIETKSELWDSEGEMIEYYRKSTNYQRLLKGEVGGNLIYKYKAKNLATAMPAWVDFLGGLLKDIVSKGVVNLADKDTAYNEIDALAKYCQNRVSGFLTSADDLTVIKMKSDYNFLDWLQGDETIPLGEYCCGAPLEFFFQFTDNQIRMKQDQFRRYGTDIGALSKIVTRIRVESFYRTVSIKPNISVDHDVDQPSRTKYALSN